MIKMEAIGTSFYQYASFQNIAFLALLDDFDLHLYLCLGISLKLLTFLTFFAKVIDQY